MKSICIGILVILGFFAVARNWQVLAAAAGGVVGYRDSLVSGQGSPNVRNWRARTGPPSWFSPTNKYDYNYWITTLGPKVSGGNTLGNGTSINATRTLNGMNSANAVNYYRVNGSLNIDTDQTLAAGSTNDLIILVDGGLDINAKITRLNKGSFLGFFVGGDINVSPSIGGNDPVIDGFFLSNGIFHVNKVGTGDDIRFLANGIFIAFAGFEFTRNLGNDLTNGNPAVPAEKFIFDPSLVVNAPADLGKSSYTWKEIAP